MAAVNLVPITINEHANSADAQLTPFILNATERLQLKNIEGSYFRSMSRDSVGGVGAVKNGVVKKFNDFERENIAGDTIRIPLGDLDFSGQSATLADSETNEVYGDKSLIEQEGKQKLKHVEVVVNMRKTAIALPAAVAEQRVKTIKLIKESGPQLVQKESKNFDIHCFAALTEGFSRNITAPTAQGGLAKAKTFHENVFALGGSSVTALTSTTLCALVDTTTTTNNLDSTDVLTWDRVRFMGKHATVKLITPLEGNMYALVAHEYSYNDLETSDSGLWATLQSNANERGKTNPLFQRALGNIGNVILHSSQLTPGIKCDVASSDILTYDFSGDESYSNYRAIFLQGSGALCHASVSKMHFADERRAYGDNNGLALKTFDGIARGSYKDNSAASTLDLNQSSIFYVTFFDTPTI